MSEMIPVIKPERAGIWAAAAFIVALLALGTAVVGLFRIQAVGLASGTHALMLNKKIEDMKGGAVAAPAAPAPAKNGAKP